MMDRWPHLRLGPDHRRRPHQRMVCHRGRRPSHQNLGLGELSAEAHADRPHQVCGAPPLVRPSGPLWLCTGAGGSLGNYVFFCQGLPLRTAPRTTNRQPLPTATNHQSPTTNRRQPPPTATSRQSPTANRQSPPTANRQPPPNMVEHMSYTRSVLQNCRSGTLFSSS